MSFASQAVRSGAVASGGPSTATLALVGFGAFCVANPERAMQMVQKALLSFSDGSSAQNNGPQPIVIHTGGNGSVGGGPNGRGNQVYGWLIQLGVGAGLCWGSYAVLVSVLPETAKNMLPVTQKTFNKAVTSLGKGLLNVKESLTEEMVNLFQLQNYLQQKQDETHNEVLLVRDQVSDVHDDLNEVQSSLDDCQRALQSTDKRTTYIARGIRLVTKGMAAVLPPDDDLIRELDHFQKASHEGPATTSRKKPDAVVTSRSAPSRSSRRSRSQSSQASRTSGRSGADRSRSSRRSASRGEYRNKVSSYQMDAPSGCSSVSTGTPIKNVVIPHRKSESRIEGANKDLKELDEVRALLMSMDKPASIRTPLM